MRAVLADAGPLYAIADESDALHERATQELQQLERDACEVLVAYPTLLETYSLVL
jgi:predicted nucleic acid-binding protein